MDNEMEKQTFLNNFTREGETTHNVLAAFPTDKLDLKPHEKLRTAKEIMMLFPYTDASLPVIAEKGVVPRDWPPEKIEANDTPGIVAAYDKYHAEALDAIRKVSAEDLAKEMDAWGMKIRRIDTLWFMLMDNIHHRGQFSIYLRLADAKVPSIYGPTADYPM
jgi:uncharacterized damage-inducible protein DinB